MPRKIYNRGAGAGNRRRLRRLVSEGPPPGLLAYDGDLPVGWVSFGPRTDFPVLENSRVLKRVDERPVWSVVCLFVDRRYRHQGVTVGLLGAAVEHARRRGARWIEGYPIDPAAGPIPAAFAFTGLAAAFLQAGFREVARRSPTRPIMRRTLRPRRRALTPDPSPARRERGKG
ncbi:MAG TPA: GNAT family N-acetyltransferase [Anaerolineales bacterium]|nr:GNAT family N-acetyltransferase [Anaerolineales bacterium]